MIHAEFDHRHLRSRPQLEERERQADVVVEVPRVAKYPIPRRKKRRCDFLCCRLPCAPRDRDDLRTGAPPHVARDVLEAARRVFHRDQHGVAMSCCRGLCRAGCRHLDQRALRPASQRVGDEAMPVEALAVDGHEEVTSPHCAGVDRDSVDRLIRASMYEPAAGAGHHVPCSQRHPIHGTTTRSSRPVVAPAPCVPPPRRRRAVSGRQ